MKIITEYTELCKAIDRVSAVFNDKTLSEDLRSILFVVKDNTVYLCTGNQETFVKTRLPLKGIETAEDLVFSLSVKSLQSRLSGFATLGLTRVDSVTLEYDTEKKVTYIRFAEVAKDEKSPYAAQYAKTTIYNVDNMVVQKYQTQMLDTLLNQEKQTDGTPIKSSEVNFYLDALLPILPKDTVDNQATRITICDDYVYAVPKTCTVLMKNHLSACLNNVVFRRTAAQFVRHFMTLSELTYVRQWLPDDASSDSVVVMLTFWNEDTIAVVRAMTTKVRYDISAFVEVPVNGITVERRYLMDVIRRINIAGDDVNVTINCDACTLEFASKNGFETIPVVGVAGKGVYSFVLTPSVLSLYTMDHFKTEAEYACLFADSDEQGRITFACADSTTTWHTMVRRLLADKGDFGWKSKL